MDKQQRESLSQAIDNFFKDLNLGNLNRNFLYDLVVKQCHLISEDCPYFGMNFLLEQYGNSAKNILPLINYKNFDYEDNYFYNDERGLINSFTYYFDYYYYLLDIQSLDELKDLIKQEFLYDLKNDYLEDLAEKLAFVFPVNDEDCVIRDFITETIGNTEETTEETTETTEIDF